VITGDLNIRIYRTQTRLSCHYSYLYVVSRVCSHSDTKCHGPYIMDVGLVTGPTRYIGLETIRERE